MPHLLHLVPQAAIGGCEVNCLRLIEGLPGFGHTVLVFSARGPMSKKWEASGADVQHLCAWDAGRGAFLAALRLWAPSVRPPDAVVFWSTSRVADILGALEALAAPWVVYLGNPAPRSLPQRLRLLLAEALRGAPARVRLVACSERVAATHRSCSYFRRFPVKVAYNAVSDAYDRDRTHRTLEPASAPRIGMVARLDPIKDHRTLIRALAALSSRRPDLRLEFAGDGPLRPALEAEALRLGVGERVRFLGFVEVGPRLAQWDLCVHSTTEEEGMGTAVAEAMMAGLPCVVSDLTVMREVCGEAGAYFAAGDHAALADRLLSLLGDLGERKRLGLAARERARRMYSVSGMAQAYLDAFGLKAVEI